jgi:hypothetical protein
MGLAKDKETRDRLHSSFKVIGKEDAVDPEGKLSERAIDDERKRIANIYLVSLANYGNVILRTNRPKFEQEIEELRLLVARFGEKLKERLDTIIAGNARKLADTLFGSVKAKRPERWTRILGPNPTDHQLKEQLEDDLRTAFGNGDDLVSEMKVKLLFKGVTYQTLTDPKFIELAKQKFPKLRLLDEFDAARGTKE